MSVLIGHLRGFPLTGLTWPRKPTLPCLKLIRSCSEKGQAMGGRICVGGVRVYKVGGITEKEEGREEDCIVLYCTPEL